MPIRAIKARTAFWLAFTALWAGGAASGPLPDGQPPPRLRIVAATSLIAEIAAAWQAGPGILRTATVTTKSVAPTPRRD